MNDKLNVQDLITTGIFTAIFVIVTFIFGMLGYIPILMVMLPVLVPIVGGIPFMLFLTKVEKFGMVTLMGVLVGLVMFLSGHTWVPIVFFTVFGVLADYILKLGNYKSFKNSMIAYGVFCLGIMGNMLPLWIMRDAFSEYLTTSMGAEYANTVLSLTQDWVFVVLVIAAFIAGMIGAIIGRKVLNKHFIKAGIA